MSLRIQSPMPDRPHGIAYRDDDGIWPGTFIDCAGAISRRDCEQLARDIVESEGDALPKSGRIVEVALFEVEKHY